MTKDLAPSALSHAHVQIAAARKRGMLPAPAEMTREWLVAELEHAGRTLQSLPVKGTRPSEYGSGWPDVVHAAEVAYGWVAERARPSAPSAKDIARMDIAFGWIGLIPEGKRTLRRVVMMRALVDPITDRHLWSFGRIGAALGWSRDYAQKQWVLGITLLEDSINKV